MSLTHPPLDDTFQRLREVRLLLLNLHKALLDSERVSYEQIFGPIQSRGEFFQLVIGHDWFNWLRPISQFIVQIDEAIAGKEPLTLSKADELLEDARQLMQPSEVGSPLEQHYYQAIQRDPDIASMHGQLTQLLKVER
jgi:hypothetical protein